MSHKQLFLVTVCTLIIKLRSDHVCGIYFGYLNAIYTKTDAIYKLEVAEFILVEHVNTTVCGLWASYTI